MAEGAKSSQPGGLLRRLNFTPMRDLIRGRLTSRYDFYGQLVSAFPEPLAKHLLRIVRWTRLDMREQVDVTHDLIARCSQLLDSGKLPEDVIRELDKKKTARSIRKQYQSQRGCLRRVFDRTVFAIAISPLFFGAIYVLAVAFFWFSYPTLTVDYLAKLNEPANAVPEQDRAWPGYRQALIDLNRPVEKNHEPLMDGMSSYQPRWPEMVAFLQDHRDTLALVREAALKPGLGLTVGYPGYYQDDDAMAVYGPSEDDPLVLSAREVADWHHIQKPMETIMWQSETAPLLGRLARLIASDAYLAIQNRDPDRFCDDISAMFKIARHAAETPTIDNGIWGISIRGLACEVISDVLVTDSDVLQDKHLRLLVELMGGDGSISLISIEGSRIKTMDMIQRVYTDNGSGGGWLTPNGICILSHRWGEI